MTAVPPQKKGARPLAEIVSRVIAPVTAERGFATADLIAAWPEIVGPAHADCTRPERIAWPRRTGDEPAQGVLYLRVDGPRAIFVQHELPQIAERINAFFGYAAIGGVRIVQAPVAARRVAPAARAGPGPEAEAALAERLAPVPDEALRAALARLGREVLAGRRE